MITLLGMLWQQSDSSSENEGSNPSISILDKSPLNKNPKGFLLEMVLAPSLSFYCGGGIGRRL